MGGNPYHYVVPLHGDLQGTLDWLRAREFRAGRYHPVLMFPLDDPSATPGAQHASIGAACDAAAENGTRSILDIARIGDEEDYGVASPVDVEDVETYCGTARPSREAALARLSKLMAYIDRGQARYLILYDDGEPTEVLFMGYSYD